MQYQFRFFFPTAVLGALALWFGAQWLPAQQTSSKEEQLAVHRNLGKAFYENPTTQKEAVAEFEKALQLNPNSPRERLNVALAKLRAGQVKEALAELEAIQKVAPQLPHTWWNLGVQWKRMGEPEKALPQMEAFVKLVPDDAAGHYNLGVLHKQNGDVEKARLSFLKAAELNQNIFAPHFQLFNIYRQAGKAEEAKAELANFQRIKKEQEGSAIPEDMDWNFFSEVLDEVEKLPETKAPAALSFAWEKLGHTADPATATIADTHLGILVSSKSGVLLLGRDGKLAWKAPAGATFAAAGDANNDGSEDLVVLSASGAVLYQQAAGQWKPGKTLHAGAFRSALWFDYDHDYDVDLLLVGSDTRLLRNEGAAGFADATAALQLVEPGASGAALVRAVLETKGMDLVLLHPGKGATLYRDQLAARFRPQPLGKLQSALAADMANRGELDLVHSGGILQNVVGKFQPKLSQTGILGIIDAEGRGQWDLLTEGGLLRNQGNYQFVPVAVGGWSALAAATGSDLNRDGLQDIVAVGKDGQLLRAVNTTAQKANWISLQLEGVKNPKLAPGSEVEVKAGPLYLKRLYLGGNLTFPLRQYGAADTIRITWPNGLIQNETKLAANKVHKVQEAQRLSGSCPIIWTWNGKEFVYITDVLGVAPLGASAGDGNYFPVDHDEYIQISGEQLQPKDGKLEVRITEELSEVAFLDEVKLVAVDHPEQQELFTNDKFKSPPFPEFRLFGVERRVAPVKATDHKGRNVLSKLLRKDRQYADGFARGFDGLAEYSHVDLDFTGAAPDGKAVLVLSGWVDWADGSTFVQAAQTRQQKLVMPYLQVKNQQGQWQTVIADMGMPAGKPKTIVVDLSGKWLSASRQVRIASSLCLYWDEIFLSERTEAPQHRMTELTASAADLRFRGFSKVTVHPQRLQPEEFAYTPVRPVSMWNPTPGDYTRFGNVTPLLRAADDAYVIMGSGDELVLQFADELPPLAAGWRRDYLLKVDGWAKDRDANTAYSQTVGPLPFHAMKQYPYGPESQPPKRPEMEQYTSRPALRLQRPLNGR